MFIKEIDIQTLQFLRLILVELVFIKNIH